MSILTRLQKAKPEPAEQARSKSQPQPVVQSAESDYVETDAETEAWAKRMLEKVEEMDRKNPGWFERSQKFWDESGELEDYR